MSFLLSQQASHRQALAAAADIQQKRAVAEAVGMDIEPVLEAARKVNTETAYAWEYIWPLMWEKALDAHLKGLS